MQQKTIGNKCIKAEEASATRKAAAGVVVALERASSSAIYFGRCGTSCKVRIESGRATPGVQVVAINT